MVQLPQHLPSAKTAADRDLIQRQTPHPVFSGVDATDRSIDALVASRELYGLTAAAREIKIVEGT